MHGLRIIFMLAAAFLAMGCLQPEAQSGNAQASVQATTYDLAEVAKHNKESDCWMAINGSVYDLTAYVSGHPGGKSMLQGCGTNATALFETRPMGSGTPHSQRARGMLGKYYKGDLVE